VGMILNVLIRNMGCFAKSLSAELPIASASDEFAFDETFHRIGIK